MKRILMVNASQSKRGCGRNLLEALVSELGALGRLGLTDFAELVDGQRAFGDLGECDYSVIRMDLKKLTYKGCIDCGYCSKHRGCMLRDDIKYMYRYFDEADHILLATPVYFGGAPSKLKALIDRMQAVYHSKYTLNDPLIDRNKKRSALQILSGGEPYSERQFGAIRYELDYFYRSVNTTLRSDVAISNTDRVDPSEDRALSERLSQEFRALLRD